MVAGRGGVNGPDLSNIGKQLTLRATGAGVGRPRCPHGEPIDCNLSRLGVVSRNGWTVVNVRLRNWLQAPRFRPQPGKT